MEHPLHLVDTPEQHPAVRMLAVGAPPDEDPRRRYLTIALLTPLLLFLPSEGEYELVSDQDEEWESIVAMERVEDLPALSVEDVLPGESMSAYVATLDWKELCLYLVCDDGHQPALCSVIRRKQA